MALSQRNRAKQAAIVQPLLPPGSTLRAYVVGRGNARITNSAIVVAAVFAAVFIFLLVAARVIIFPGFLVLIYVINDTRPLRGIAVTEQGLALIGRSVWTGRPKGVVALMGPVPITGPVVSFGGESVKLTSKELAVLREAVGPGYAPPPAGYGVPPFS